MQEQRTRWNSGNKLTETCWQIAKKKIENKMWTNSFCSCASAFINGTFVLEYKERRESSECVFGAVH